MKHRSVLFQNTVLRKALVALFWLVLWQVIATLVNKPVLFASPAQTVKALLLLLPKKTFWQAAVSSLLRIAAGFFLALILGLLVGVAAWRWAPLRSLLSALLTFLKSVPVASFIILILVWFGSGSLTVIVSAIIVFPLIYFATVNGLSSADRSLLEMARVFRVNSLRTVMSIYRPAVMPYLLNACSSALGMCWKAGIAAEVIGTPLHSIGAQMYDAKLYMDTAALFAWTAVIIFLSLLFEKLVIRLLRKIGGCYGHKT